jgi:hypothetical protein
MWLRDRALHLQAAFAEPVVLTDLDMLTRPARERSPSARTSMPSSRRTRTPQSNLFGWLLSSLHYSLHHEQLYQKHRACPAEVP